MLVVAWDGSPHPSAAAEAVSGKQASAELPRCSERGSLESKPSFPTGQDSEGGSRKVRAAGQCAAIEAPRSRPHPRLCRDGA